MITLDITLKTMDMSTARHASGFLETAETSTITKLLILMPEYIGEFSFFSATVVIYRQSDYSTV